MTYHGDAKEIEAALTNERAELASTLGALRNRLSFRALTDDAVQAVRGKVAGSTRAVDGAVRTNPLAVAAVGAGLAWLAFGKAKATAVPAAKLEAMSNWEDDGGPARPSDSMTPEGQHGYAPGVRATSATGRMIEDHPMMTGLVLLGVGAALGWALPRTAAEDKAFGYERNRLLDKAASHLVRAATSA